MPTTHLVLSLSFFSLCGVICVETWDQPNSPVFLSLKLNNAKRAPSFTSQANHRSWWWDLIHIDDHHEHTTAQIPLVFCLSQLIGGAYKGSIYFQRKLVMIFLCSFSRIGDIYSV